MGLTNCQEKALTGLVDWIDNDDNTYDARLIGPAGTGKTYLANVVLSSCKYKFGVAVSAPTNKAKHVIAKSTGRVAMTIQKMLGLAPNTDVENFDINNPTFHPINEPEMGLYRVVLIDEASMVNSDLYKMITNTAQLLKVKILFIGDGFQLPPVKEAASPVFLVKERTWILLESVRQKPDNPLMMLLTAIRSDIKALQGQFDGELFSKFIDTYIAFTGNTESIPAITNDMFRGERIRENLFKYMLRTYPNFVDKTKGCGYELHRTRDSFLTAIYEYYLSDAFKWDSNNIKVISFRNETGDKYNELIRNKVYGNPDAQLVEKEVLTAYTTVKDVITNSEDYVVDNILTLPNGNYEVTLVNADTKIESKNIIIVNNANLVEYAREHEGHHYVARTQKGIKWREYYAWKNRRLIMRSMNTQDVIIEGVGKVYKKNLPTKDIAYGYAITSHKSQGSTYANVGIDVNDLLVCLKYDNGKMMFYNLLYVALSRATTKAILYV